MGTLNLKKKKLFENKHKLYPAAAGETNLKTSALIRMGHYFLCDKFVT